MTLESDMQHIDALLKRGDEAAIDEAAIDEAEALLGKVEHTIARIRKAEQLANDGEDEDGDEESEDDPEESEDLEADDFNKLGPRRIPPRYPGDSSHVGLHYPSDDLQGAMDENRQVEHPQTSRHTTTDPLHSKFESRVRFVASRDNLHGNMVEARRRARKEFGADFIASQRRPVSVTKSQAIARDIAKGFSPLVAEQRALASHGLDPTDIDKGETVTTRFVRKCSEIMARVGCSRTEAMTQARRENEAEFEIFREV